MELPTTGARLPLGDRAWSWVTEHPYWTVFAVALTLRLVAAVVILHWFGGSVFLDDRTYVEMAAAWAEGESGAWDPYTSWLFQRTASLLVPLGLIFKVIGPSTLAGQCLVALFGALTAVAVAYLLSLVLGRRHALAGGLLIGVWPSLVVFSATVMKDALAWVALAGLAVVTTRLNRSSGRAIYANAAGAAVILLFLGHVRVHTTVAAAWAFVLAVLLAPSSPDRLRRWGTALIVTLIVPWIVSAGPFGVRMTSAVPELADIRADHSRGGSAVPEARPSAPATRPDRGTSAEPEPESLGEDLEANVAYLPTGLSVMLFEPLPWRSSDSPTFQLARAENLAWYVLMALAVVGIWRGVRTHRDALMFPLLAGGSSLIMWSLVEGNIGTAYRHRGEFAWAVVVFAVVGASTLIGDVGSRSGGGGDAEEDPVRLSRVSGGSGRVR